MRVASMLVVLLLALVGATVNGKVITLGMSNTVRGFTGFGNGIMTEYVYVALLPLSIRHTIFFPLFFSLKFFCQVFFLLQVSWESKTDPNTT
jgi:hypothetical protein